MQESPFLRDWAFISTEHLSGAGHLSGIGYLSGPSTYRAPSPIERVKNG